MAKLSESTARQTIGMMRSIARTRPISPFHIAAADDMESLLNEVLEYRKGKNDKATKRMGKSNELAKAADGGSSI